MKNTTQYAVEWRRTLPDGKKVMMRRNVYKNKAAALKAITTWLGERAEGKMAPYQDTVEPILMERAMPETWRRRT